jgi:CRISPR-associated endonuclease/helicase Cas3
VCSSDLTPAAFAEAHERFARQRAERLTQAEPRRLAEIVPLADLPRDLDAQAEPFARRVLASATVLHAAHHDIDPVSGKRASFGLVRMANIEPLVAVALALFRLGAPAGLRIHLCVYHSQFPLLLRSGIEQRLDRALNRRDPSAVFALPEVRQPLDAHPEPDHLFIVLGSPVTEVGRDHDYDWAIVEPSSMRSLIQLAGRVRRHRLGVCSVPNLHVFSSNLRHFRAPGGPAYCRPGFETGDSLLASHDLRSLLSPDESRHIDARARIQARPADQLRPRERWVDLEHAPMRATMLPANASQTPPTGSSRRRGATAPSPAPLNAATWWHSAPQDALLTGLLQQAQPFRADGEREADLVLLPDEDGDDYALHRVVDPRAGWRTRALYQPVDASQNHRIPDAAVSGLGISIWGQTDYLATLAELAQDLDLPFNACAKRFGTVTLPEHDDGWAFHPALGFVRHLRR